MRYKDKYARLLIGGLMLTAAMSADAQMFRWTDSSGKTHFTDTPPPASAKSVQKVLATPSSPGMAVEPYVLQEARKNFPVTLYSAPGCEGCDEARRLLNARGVPFREVSVVNPAQFEELKRVSASTAIPTMIVGSEVQKGFGETAYHSMLDAAGYPATGILPARNPAELNSSESKGEAPPANPPPVRGPYAPRQGPATLIQNPIR